MTTVAVVLQSDKSESRGEASLQTTTRAAALTKGVAVWIGSWVAAVPMLFIPIVHFIAPPALFLLGPIVGIVIFKLFDGATDITAGSAPCPSCGGPIDFGRRAAPSRSAARAARPSCASRLPPSDLTGVQTLTARATLSHQLLCQKNAL